MPFKADHPILLCVAAALTATMSATFLLLVATAIAHPGPHVMITNLVVAVLFGAALLALPALLLGLPPALLAAFLVMLPAHRTFQRYQYTGVLGYLLAGLLGGALAGALFFGHHSGDIWFAHSRGDFFRASLLGGPIGGLVFWRYAKAMNPLDASTKASLLKQPPDRSE